MHSGGVQRASGRGPVHAGWRTLRLCWRTIARRVADSAPLPEENCTSGEEQRARREEHCTPDGAKCMPRPLMVPAAPRIVRGAERVTNHRLRDGSREDAKGETPGSRRRRHDAREARRTELPPARPGERGAVNDAAAKAVATAGAGANRGSIACRDGDAWQLVATACAAASRVDRVPPAEPGAKL